jgi:hypothetical protein
MAGLRSSGGGNAVSCAPILPSVEWRGTIDRPAPSIPGEMSMSLTDIGSWWAPPTSSRCSVPPPLSPRVLVAIWQLRDANKTAVGQFWLTLRGVMTEYDDIHANFRPRGRWHGSTTLPNQVNDWTRTELYMGLLEYCNTLMAQVCLTENISATGTHIAYGIFFPIRE